MPYKQRLAVCRLHIIKADPGSYIQQYGSQLRPTQGLPDFVRGLPTPNLGPEYTAGANPDQIDPALLAGTTEQSQLNPNGYEVGGDQGLLGSASNGSLSGAGQGGYGQENVQYASYANGAGQVPGEQQNAYAYQQAGYSHGSTVEGQQYAAEQQQQGYEQQGQQGNGFAQNVQYQTLPQYGVNG